MSKIYFWFKNARCISLPQSMLPAILSIGMSVHYDSFSWWLALVALFGTVCAHLGMNLADDYFDYFEGSAEKRIRLASDGIRARVAKYPYLTSGTTSIEDLRQAIAVFGILALIAGSVVVSYHGLFPIAIIIVAGGVLGISYSGGPLRLGYRGYGELVVGIMFGPLLMLGMQYACCGVWDGATLLVSIAVGLLVTNILYTHSVLDRSADTRMGKLTLAGLLAKRSFIAIVSAIFCFGPFLLVLIGTTTGLLPGSALLTLFLLPMAIYLCNSLWRYVYDLPVEPKSALWMGPMGDFSSYCEAGIGWFMMRWLLARNLISFFALILLISSLIDLFIE